MGSLKDPPYINESKSQSNQKLNLLFRFIHSLFNNNMLNLPKVKFFLIADNWNKSSKFIGWNNSWGSTPECIESKSYILIMWKRFNLFSFTYYLVATMYILFNFERLIFIMVCYCNRNEVEKTNSSRLGPIN